MSIRAALAALFDRTDQRPDLTFQTPGSDLVACEVSAAQAGVALYRSAFETVPFVLAGRPSSLGERFRYANELQSWSELAGQVAEQVVRRGRAVVYATRDRNGGITGLYCAAAATAVPGTLGSWLLSFPGEFDTLFGAALVPAQRYDVAVLNWNSQGRSPLLAAAAGMQLQGLAVAGMLAFITADNGPRNDLSTDQDLTAAQVEFMRKQFATLKPTDAAILHSGLKRTRYERSSVKDGANELAATVGLAEVARALSIPPELLGARMQGATLSTDALIEQWRVIGLDPLLAKFCASLARLDGLEPSEVLADSGALELMTRQELIAAQAQAVQSGQMTPNEARRALRLPDMAGGDTLLAQSQLAPVGGGR